MLSARDRAHCGLCLLVDVGMEAAERPLTLPCPSYSCAGRRLRSHICADKGRACPRMCMYVFLFPLLNEGFLEEFMEGQALGPVTEMLPRNRAAAGVLGFESGPGFPPASCQGTLQGGRR